MKFRKDFVTNSSSTSYIVARKEEPTDEQKEILLKFVEDYYFAAPVLKPGATEEEIREFMKKSYCDDNEALFEEMKSALAQGLSIFRNETDTEFGDSLTFQQMEMIKRLENSDNFISLREQFYY